MYDAVKTESAAVESDYQRKKVCFSVSIDPEDAVQIDERIRQIKTGSGVALTRSNYFELLARHDRTHHSIEQFFAQMFASATQPCSS
jgi:hypothetical protein